VLVMVFVTFLYGLFVPAMFIIAFVAMFNFYIVETLALAKWYRKPPMLDGILDLRANHLMRYAPIFFFLLGYWAMGNTQMFMNEPPILHFINQSPDPRHELFTTKNKLDQSHLVFIIGFLWTIRVAYESIDRCCQAYCLNEE